MITYTEQQLQDNYNAFITFLNNVFTGERLTKLLHMYSEDELGGNVILSPASGNMHYHNSYDGGYLDHVMGVAKNSLRVMKLYQDAGGVIDFTREEMLFAAIHHDLGKVGDKGKLQYLPNESEWHRKNQGKLYTFNPELAYMNVTDRTFYLLNKYGIEYSENEFFGIRLADGMFEEANIPYLKTFNVDMHLKNNIGYLLHWADHISTNVERDRILKK